MTHACHIATKNLEVGQLSCQHFKYELALSPLMSPKKCDEEAAADLMTKIRSTKTDSNKYFKVYSNISMTLFPESRRLKTSSSPDRTLRNRPLTEE